MKKLLASLAVLLLVIIVIAGCGKAPVKETVDNAIQKSQDIKSEHVDFTVNLELNGDPGLLGPQFQGFLPLNLTMSGAVDSDNSDPAAPKAKGNVGFLGIDKLLTVLAQAQGVDSQSQLSFSMIAGALANLEFVTVDNKVYLKIAGSWYDLGDSASFGGIANLTPGTASSTNVQCYKDAMKDPARFGSDKTLANLEETGDEKIDGVSTRRFTADVDVNKALTAMAEIARDCGDARQAGNLEAARTELTSFFRSFSVELWIDNDNNFRQIKFAIDTDARAFSGMVPSLGGGASSGAVPGGLEQVRVDGTAKFSQLGASFDIARPDGNIMKIEDLIGAAGLGALGEKSAI